MVFRVSCPNGSEAARKSINAKEEMFAALKEAPTARRKSLWRPGGFLAWRTSRRPCWSPALQRISGRAPHRENPLRLEKSSAPCLHRSGCSSDSLAPLALPLSRGYCSLGTPNTSRRFWHPSLPVPLVRSPWAIGPFEGSCHTRSISSRGVHNPTPSEAARHERSPRGCCQLIQRQNCSAPPTPL
jgi:hypothetical protein